MFSSDKSKDCSKQKIDFQSRKLNRIEISSKIIDCSNGCTAEKKKDSMRADVLIIISSQ